MANADWTRTEVEAIVDDYLSMLASELSGTPYSKAAHRRELLPRLSGRTSQSVEYKHANISAVLLDVGFPYLNGYKPRSNYQALLAEVVCDRLHARPDVLAIVSADVERPMAVPEVDEILSIVRERPSFPVERADVRDRGVRFAPAPTNYIEREARNRSLGHAGELFILNYERARLIHAGREELASRIEHTSQVRGDHEGFDILSFEENGAERLIEVKTTKYGDETPFFVTQNEVSKSITYASQYQVYRLYQFREAPRLFTLPGSIQATCVLSPSTYRARPK
jgi:hypothetical protein